MSPTDDELSVRAGEYVLGTMTGEERTSFEREIANNLEVRREVYAWQDRLFSLNLLAEPAEDSATLWPAIERQLGKRTARPPFWSRLSVWRWTGGLAFAAAAVLAVALALILRMGAALPEIRYVAVLLDPAGSTAGWVVDASDPGELRLIPLAPTPVPQAKALQFWTKAENADQPTSLGLLSANSVTVIPVDRLPTLEGNQLFEITLESEAGSPTGRPTGPILFLGRTVPMQTRKNL